VKQQKQIVALVVLILVAGAIWYWNTRQNPIAASASTIASNYSPMNIDGLTLRGWERDTSRKSEYKGTGRNPFSAVPPPPPPVPTPKPGDKNYVPPPPPPPPRADLPPNMKFYGYGTIPNGTARRAFLTDGEEVYVVAEGDTLLGRFRILKIGNATLEFEDISSHVQGQKNLEDLGPNAVPGPGL
jgi:hypothetical protein